MNQIQPEDPLSPHPLPPKDFNNRDLPIVNSKGTEVLHYTQFLLETHTKSTSQSQKKRQAGFLKGTFVLPLAEDFNEPLEDFQEYME